MPDGLNDKDFDEVGNYRHRTNSHQSVMITIEDQPLLNYAIDNFITASNINAYSYNVTNKDSEVSYELLRPLFNWQPLSIIIYFLSYLLNMLAPQHLQ